MNGILIEHGISSVSTVAHFFAKVMRYTKIMRKDEEVSCWLCHEAAATDIANRYCL